MQTFQGLLAISGFNEQVDAVGIFLGNKCIERRSIWRKIEKEGFVGCSKCIVESVVRRYSIF